MGSQGARSVASSDAAVREACRFLELQVEPALAKAREGPLVKAIQNVVRSTDLSSLGRLPERQRRRLLGAVEERLDHGRRTPSPEAVVTLTSALSARGQVDASFGRGLAPPAR